MISEEESDVSGGPMVCGSIALTWRQEANDFLVSLGLGDCMSPLSSRERTRSNTRETSAHDDSSLHVLGSDVEGVALARLRGGFELQDVYESKGSDRSQEQSSTSDGDSSEAGARPLPPRSVRLDEERQREGSRGQSGALDANQSSPGERTGGTEDAWLKNLRASEWWRRGKVEEARQVANASKPASAGPAGPHVMMGDDLAEGPQAEADYQTPSGAEPHGPEPTSRQDVGWGRGVIERVEDVSVPEEEDGSIRVIADISPPPTREVREELVNTDRFCAVDAACKRRVLGMPAGTERELLEDMICLQERIAMEEMEEADRQARASQCDSQLAANVGVREPLGVHEPRRAEGQPGGYSLPDLARAATDISGTASGGASQPAQTNFAPRTAAKSDFSESALPLRELGWKDVCMFLHALDVDESAIAIVEKEKVPGPQLAQMSEADLMQDLNLSKLQARRIMVHLDLCHPWQEKPSGNLVAGSTQAHGQADAPEAAEARAKQKDSNTAAHNAGARRDRGFVHDISSSTEINPKRVFEEEARDLAAAYQIFGVPEDE